jgi:hypothetical protein
MKPGGISQIRCTMSPPPPLLSSSSSSIFPSVNPTDENAEKPNALGKVSSFPDPFASWTASLLGSTISPALSLWIRSDAIVHEHYILKKTRRRTKSHHRPSCPSFLYFSGPFVRRSGWIYVQQRKGRSAAVAVWTELAWGRMSIIEFRSRPIALISITT